MPPSVGTPTSAVSDEPEERLLVPELDHDRRLPVLAPGRDSRLPVPAPGRDSRLPVLLGTDQQARPPRSRLGVPAAVWLLTLAFAALLACYTLVVPTYRAPDEPAHVDMVRFAAGDQPWPFTGGRELSREVTATFDVVRWAYEGRDREPPLPREAAPPRAERPSFGAAAPDSPSGQGNQMAQHPPLYYELQARVLGAAEAVSPGPWSFDQTVGFLRLTTAAMLLPLPLLAWATARRLGADTAVGVTAAAVPLGIPVLTHIGGSVSNDPLLVLLIGLCTWLAARVLTGDRSPGTAVALGVTGGAALLTKGFALFVPVWVAGVYVLGAWRARQGGGSLATGAGGLVALGLSATIGGPWWIRNLLVLGTVQPSFARPPPAGPDFTPAVGDWLATAATRLNGRFWGEFGWAQASLPEPVMAGASAVVGLGLIAAVLWRPVVIRRGAAALLVPLAGLLAILVYGAWTHYADTGAMALLNGRYLFPAVVGVAVAAGAGWGRLLGARGRLLPLATVAAAIGLQLLALHTVVRRYWGTAGHDSLRESVAALLAWSPWPPWVASAAAAAAAGLLVALGVVLLRDLARQRT